MTYTSLFDLTAGVISKIRATSMGLVGFVLTPVAAGAANTALAFNEPWTAWAPFVVAGTVQFAIVALGGFYRCRWHRRALLRVDDERYYAAGG